MLASAKLKFLDLSGDGLRPECDNSIAVIPTPCFIVKRLANIGK